MSVPGREETLAHEHWETKETYRFPYFDTFSITKPKGARFFDGMHKISFRNGIKIVVPYLDKLWNARWN